MKFLNESVSDAVEHVVFKDLEAHGGLEGAIALDNRGNGEFSIASLQVKVIDKCGVVALELNSSGMYRGVIRKDGVPMTAIFNDDVLE